MWHNIVTMNNQKESFPFALFLYVCYENKLLPVFVVFVGNKNKSKIISRKRLYLMLEKEEYNG